MEEIGKGSKNQYAKSTQVECVFLRIAYNVLLIMKLEVSYEVVAVFRFSFFSRDFFVKPFSE